MPFKSWWLVGRSDDNGDEDEDDFGREGGGDAGIQRQTLSTILSSSTTLRLSSPKTQLRIKGKRKRRQI